MSTLLALLASPPAQARGLSVGMRIRQDFFQPLVPVSRAIKTCFQPDTSGNPALSICTEGGAPRARRGAFPQPEARAPGSPKATPERKQASPVGF